MHKRLLRGNFYSYTTLLILKIIPSEQTRNIYYHVLFFPIFFQNFIFVFFAKIILRIMSIDILILQIDFFKAKLILNSWSIIRERNIITTILVLVTLNKQLTSSYFLLSSSDFSQKITPPSIYLFTYQAICHVFDQF